MVILGSSSLLPQHPELGEPGQPLEVSLDADLLIEPVDQMIADLLKEAIGQESAFERRNGYYADIMRPTMAETFPAGWESRLHPVPGYDNVFALDVYDLAIVKLRVGRAKDIDLLEALIRLGILAPDRIQEHYGNTPLNERDAFKISRNLDKVLRKISPR